MALMKPMSPLLLTALLLLSAATTATATGSAAFNITRLLEQYPDFGAFNDYLTRTGLADLINNRQTITVLALDNRTVSATLDGMHLNVVKDILAGQVVLDFLGPRKLRSIVLEKRGAMFATLFQATGKAAGRQGFVNVSVSEDDGVIAFGSAIEGSPKVAKLVGAVTAKPFNISVLHVSAPIVPQGVDPNPRPLQPPAPAEEDSPAEAPGPGSDKEVADAPVASAPEADGPEADALSPNDAPASSPPEPEVDDAGIVVEIPDSEKSGSSSVLMGSVYVGVTVRLLSFLVTL